MIRAIVRRTIEGTLTDEEKGNLQFMFGITLNTAHLNSFTNAVLFLINNVKSKQYLRSTLKGTAATRGNKSSNTNRILTHGNSITSTAAI